MKLLWPACKILSCVQLQLSAELWKLIYEDCGPFDLIKYAPFIQHTRYKTHTVVTAGNSETEGGWGKVAGYCTAQYHVLLRGNYWPLGPQSWSPDEKFPEPTILVGFLECYLSVGYRLGGRRGKIVDERARSGGGGGLKTGEKLRLKVTKCFVLHQRKNCITTELHQQDDGPNPRAGPQLGRTMQTGGDLDKNLTLKLGKCSRLSRLLTP